MSVQPIEVRDLTKRFSDTTAIDSLSLTIRRNEVFGLLGPNGAGKSTLIDIIAGYKRPTAGTVTVFGRNPTDGAETDRRCIGVLPDSAEPYSDWSGTEHVEFVLQAHDIQTDPVDVLNRVGLESAADRPTREYSEGMKTRLLLAMAVASRPDILILDEPSTGIDPEGMELVRALVAEERSRGAIILFSSHRLAHVEAVCDRVGIIHQGKLDTVDAIDTLRESVATDDTLVADVDDTDPIDPKQLLEITGVVDVTLQERSVIVTCEDRAKKRVLDRIEAFEATVVDISVTEQTLEDAYLSISDRVNENG